MLHLSVYLKYNPMKPLFIWYPKCSTCQKADEWLQHNHIEVEKRNIVEDRPTYDELDKWITASGIEISKFFNTSGIKYRAMNLSPIVKSASREDLLKLLASDGMLVKRPLLITDNKVFVGFKEPLWAHAR